MLINSFLLLDIAWAGGTELSVITPKEMLSAPVQISQQMFDASFGKLYEKNTSPVTDSPTLVQKEEKSKWMSLLYQAYSDEDSNFFSGLKSILIPAFLTTAFVALSSKSSWSGDGVVAGNFNNIFSVSVVSLIILLGVFRISAKRFSPQAYHTRRIKELERKLKNINVPLEAYEQLQAQLRKAIVDASKNLVDSGNGYNPLAIVLRKIDNLEESSRIKTEMREHREALETMAKDDEHFEQNYEKEKPLTFKEWMSLLYQAYLEDEDYKKKSEYESNPDPIYEQVEVIDKQAQSVYAILNENTLQLLEQPKKSSEQPKGIAQQDFSIKNLNMDINLNRSFLFIGRAI